MIARPPRTRRHRWFGSVRISSDGRVRFSPLTFDGLGPVAIWDRPPNSVDVLIGGHQVLFLYLHRSRVVSACFVYTLSPVELRDAVKTLRGVPGGLASWIVPALEWTQSTPTMVRPDLIAAIPEVLESCRDLPIAEFWRRRRKAIQEECVERLRNDPEELSKIRAPWMLPEGYVPPTGAPPRPKKSRKPSPHPRGFTAGRSRRT